MLIKSAIPWEMLLQERWAVALGLPAGVEERLREWQEAGVWERLPRVLLDRLGEADQIDWERSPV